MTKDTEGENRVMETKRRSDSRELEIAVMADQTIALGFGGLGLVPCPVEPGDDVGARLKELVDSGRFAVIYIADSLTVNIRPLLEEYHTRALPIITPLPDGKPGGRDSLALLRNAVKRATGFDLLANRDIQELDEKNAGE